MAYLRDITKKCRDCGNRASVELVNQHNGTMGAYCGKDGKRALKQALDDEPRTTGGGFDSEARRA